MSDPTPWYVAVERFSPKINQEAWSKYIDFCHLNQLKEVVSLDSSLCPNIIHSPIAEDWKFLVKEDPQPFYFTDLDYLIRRVKANPITQILAIIRNSLIECKNVFNDTRFTFLGYDLMDKDDDISALLNCGGFPEVFSNHELSEYGLILSLERANEVRKLLKEKNPEERHADCNVWAIWRLLET